MGQARTLSPASSALDRSAALGSARQIHRRPARPVGTWCAGRAWRWGAGPQCGLQSPRRWPMADQETAVNAAMDGVAADMVSTARENW